ncbi:MAG: response regulator [Deltaproteobacteria bacterium]|nr:response regulator [Deltaproteobacteria bacterium]
MADRKLLGERLVEAGFLSPEHLQTAVEYQNEHGGRLGDVLVEQGYVSESAMLRFLAAEYNTRYVSTEKLSKVKIPSAILERIPVRMAEGQLLLPILWDDARKVLSVVMAEPQNVEVQIEIQLVSEAASVQAYIATRAAIRAAVRKHYYGDISAFADLEADRPRPRRDQTQPDGQVDDVNRSFSGLSVATQTAPAADTGSIAPTSVRQAVDAVQSASLTTDNDFVETLNVLVGLIEMPRARFKGHSAAVAKLALQICRRMNLGQRETNHIVMAAYLHDLGKKEDLHLTLPGISELDLFRKEAKRYYRTPLRLMEAVRLPNPVNTILGQLYEAWDGSGVPEGTAGASITLGARIIAAVDAYEDFIRVPREGESEPLDRDAALREVQAYAGTVLDPQVVELLRETLTGDLMRRRLLAQGQHILIVDPDPENASLLELKLSQRGYVVSLARDYDTAMEIAEDGTDLVIAEANLPDRDGFTLLETLREKPWGRSIPFVFLTAEDNPTAVEKGLRLGAADYVVKPYAVVVFLAKIKRILEAYGESEARNKSIRGTLDEIKLEDIVSILGDAGRSGQIHVEGKNRSGEIFLDRGRVVNAVFESIRGEEAFTGILTIRRGRFTFNPQVEVLDRAMDEAAEEILGRAKERLARGSKG